MSFLAQVRLADLPRRASALRRHRGLLLLFTDVEFEPGETEIGLWAGKCTRVLHVPAGRAMRRVAAPPGAKVMRLRPARMTFRARIDTPDLTLDADRLAPPLQDIEISDAEAYWKFRDGLRPRAEQLEHRLLGYIDQPNGGDDCSTKTDRERNPWRLLVTIGYDEGIGFEVADAGRLQVVISPSDLRRGRFSRACGVFDSG